MSQQASVGPWEIALQEVETPIGLVVSAVRLWGNGASFQTKPFSYQMQGKAEVEAMVHEAHLEAFVRTKLPDNLQNPKLKIEAGRIVLQATVRLILPVNATVVCTLAIEEKKRVMVVLESVEVLGAGVKGMVQKHIDAINPVLDAGELPFEVELQSVRLEPERLILTGDAVPPPVPPKKGAPKKTA
jgi:hypothetical protein